jgi:hypothetical protein
VDATHADVDTDKNSFFTQPALWGWLFLVSLVELEEGGLAAGKVKKCPVDIFLARGRIPSLRGNPVPKGEARLWERIPYGILSFYMGIRGDGLGRGRP